MCPHIAAFNNFNIQRSLVTTCVSQVNKVSAGNPDKEFAIEAEIWLYVYTFRPPPLMQTFLCKFWASWVPVNMEKQLKIDLDSLSPLSATSPPTLLLTWLSAQPLTPWFRFPLPTPLTMPSSPHPGHELSLISPSMSMGIFIGSSINPKEWFC
jgi:hypothetical protein